MSLQFGKRVLMAKDIQDETDLLYRHVTGSKITDGFANAIYQLQSILMRYSLISSESVLYI